MEKLGTEDYNYWAETNMLFQTDQLDGWALDEAAFSGYYDSSSPDGSGPSPASKNIVSERNRRKKLNERLFALRAVVPNITKMDKASIIKDAIEYIEHLKEQEKRIEREIMELESAAAGDSHNLIKPLVLDETGAGAGVGVEYHHQHHHHHEFEEDLPLLLRSKKKRIENILFDSSSPSPTCSTNYSPIEIIELRVTYMGERTFVVSLRCNKKTDTMVKLCEAFQSLKLKVITANITSFSGTLLKTLFIQADEEEKEILKIKIQTAIAALNDPPSPMSI